MSEELKPCPFCGGTDTFVERLDYSAAYVQCDSSIGEHCACLARGPVGVQDDDGEEIPGGAAAIRAWNRRTPAEPAPASTGREPMNAAGFFAEARRIGCKGFPDALEMATRDPVAARELNAKTERVRSWQERCDWQSSEPATKLMVEAMKAEIAELRTVLAARFRAEGGSTKIELSGNSGELAEAAQVSTEQAGDAQPRTFMTDAQAFEWSWAQLKKDLNADRWNAGDEVQSWAFYKYGWDYRAQYERQRVAPSPNNSPVGADKEP